MDTKEILRAKEILESKRKYAIVGVSQDVSKYSYEVFHLMKDQGYIVYPINPRYAEIDGYKCYSSIEDIPEKPEVIIVIMAPNNIEKIIDNLLNSKDHFLWFPPECYSDSIIKKVEDSVVPYLYDVCPVGIIKGFTKENKN